jgi:DNA-binding XRE family transcriptional regulator
MAIETQTGDGPEQEQKRRERFNRRILLSEQARLEAIELISKLVYMRRDLLKIPQGELASAMGIEQPSLARFETGRYGGQGVPRLDTIMRYCLALGVKLVVDASGAPSNLPPAA